RPARLVPRTVHRDALLDTLPVEQRPIAEQLAVGGLPAVRRALAEQRAAARAEGRPEVAGEAIVTLAEQLLPRVKEATWRDRAEAVADRLDSVPLRDLRAVVTTATARDDDARALLGRLREALDARVTKLRTTWEQDVARALEEGRVLQALRLSSRTPEPTARFPAGLVQPLAEAAGNALTVATPPDRWLTVLEAAAASPVRRLVKPGGVPSDEDDRTRKAAAAYAGRIPALAGLLGLAMPPPPRSRPAPPPPRRGPVAPAAAAAAADAVRAPGDDQAPAPAETEAPALDAPEAAHAATGVTEAPASEAPAPEAPVSDAPVSEAPDPEAAAPEAAAPEAPDPEAAAPEAAAATTPAVETGLEAESQDRTEPSAAVAPQEDAEPALEAEPQDRAEPALEVAPQEDEAGA
ncbi:MAG: hypothetical protein M0T71_12445, partial [Actinomycetota bacterium]|nr:hypothetical protein [Actinomycetota bacterium]